MKYCMSGRQPRSVLAKADEIKMRFSDADRMIDYIEEFPDKTFILEIPRAIAHDDINWELYAAYSDKINFMFCLADLALAEECKHHKIKFYWSNPVYTWYELHSLLELEPCYIALGAPLSFNLAKVRGMTSTPIRLCPNLANEGYMPRTNGIYGCWIRPEDVDSYGEYVDCLEFFATELSHEQTLFHIYKENKAWPGNLNLLFTNFNINIDNRAVPEELGRYRMICGQRCMETGTCHLCENAILFAEKIRNKHYKTKLTDE